MSSIDAFRAVVQSGGSVPRDPVEVIYERCRERLGPMGFTQEAYRKGILEALADAPADELEKRIKTEDMYLALGCLVGHRRAWQVFDQTYRGYLLRQATRYCGGREQAEDLVTDLFHDLITRKDRPGKLHQYKGYASLATWLAVIVRRMVMDRGRMRERQLRRNERLKAEGVATAPRKDPERSYAHAQASRLAGDLFAEAFRALPERHVLVLTLLYRDGMTLREAGHVMGLDFSTVSRRAKAARKALQEVMTNLAKERHGLEDDAIAGLFLEGAGGTSFAQAKGAG